MMGSMDGVRRRVVQAALAALLALAPAVSAAVFDDGNDRKFVKELRAKDPATLTDEEKAVLAAANKVGDIGLCAGKHSGNAFVIRHKACPINGVAVVTSAHFLLDEAGKLKCPWDKALDADYLPNRSYFYEPSHRKDGWIMKQVKLQFPPANWSEIEGRSLAVRSPDDIAVFCLAEDITRDRMPDGSRRGHLRFGTAADIDGRLYMLGLAPDFGNFTLLTYQTNCNGFVRDRYVYHACDNIGGSSGSLLGTMERGEIRFRGVHNDGLKDVGDLPAARKKDEWVLNGGTASDRIYADRHEDAFDHAYDLQWALQQAGCYAGALDGEWGPASKAALVAFSTAAATELPGTEPSPELLVTVEKAASEEPEVCR